MGQNSIDRGNKDSWTVTPKMLAAAKSREGRGPSSRRLFRNPAKRDPRGYVIPADQPDFLTATKFVNTLIATGADGPPGEGGVHSRRARSTRPAPTS